MYKSVVFDCFPTSGCAVRLRGQVTASSFADKKDAPDHEKTNFLYSMPVKMADKKEKIE